MMPDMKYEPDLVLSMVSPGTITGTAPRATVTKSRYAILEKGKTYDFTTVLLENLRQYLEEGADPQELKNQQKAELLGMLKELLQNQSKATMFPFVLEQLVHAKDADISALTLEALKDIYSTLI